MAQFCRAEVDHSCRAPKAVDRYADLLGFYADNPEVGKLHEEMCEYLESQTVERGVPTYFQFWEDEEYRRRLWVLERDPIARGMMMRIDRIEREIIDVRATGRLKPVADGSHLPIENQAEPECDPSND